MMLGLLMRVAAMPSSVSLSGRAISNNRSLKLILADSHQESATIPTLGELAQ